MTPRIFANSTVKAPVAVDLPAHSVGGLAQEVGDLVSLLALLKKGHELTTAAELVAVLVWAPEEDVGEEDHQPPLVVDLHPGLETPKTDGQPPSLPSRRTIPARLFKSQSPKSHGDLTLSDSTHLEGRGSKG